MVCYAIVWTWSEPRLSFRSLSSRSETLATFTYQNTTHTPLYRKTELCLYSSTLHITLSSALSSYLPKMSSADPKLLPLPPSYASLPFEQIRISHVPESSKEVTPVVVLTLNRPQKLNAFTVVLMRELEQAFQLFDIDDRVRCIVLTGAGRVFCAGADLVRPISDWLPSVNAEPA